MQAEFLKRRFEIKDDLHRLISGIELSRSLKTEAKKEYENDNAWHHFFINFMEDKLGINYF